MKPTGFDRFGSTLRLQQGTKSFLDLTLLSVPFWPVIHPASIHFYNGEDGIAILSKPFTTYTRIATTIKAAEKILTESGHSYLLYIEIRDTNLMYVRSHAIERGTPECVRAVHGPPKMMCEWLEPTSSHDPTRYPHTCPRCSRPAYIGLNDLECSNKDCH